MWTNQTSCMMLLRQVVKGKQFLNELDVKARML